MVYNKVRVMMMMMMIIIIIIIIIIQTFVSSSMSTLTAESKAFPVFH